MKMIERIVEFCKKRWYVPALVLLLLGICIIVAATSHDKNEKQAKDRVETSAKAETGKKDKSSKKDKKKDTEEATKEAASAKPEVSQPPASQYPAAAAGAQVFEEPETHVESEGARKAYLTFDDGSSEQTDRILDILAQYGVKATFFVTAQSGEENAARYRRIVEEGHSIGLHSVSHDYKQVYASLDSYIADVEGIRQFVLQTTGVNTYLYRFPGGSSNTVSKFPIEDCIRYLKQNGYRYYDWNIDTSDAVNHKMSAQELAANALCTTVDKYHNCVILMHDSGAQHTTVEALPMIIEGLLARGMEILPITHDTPLVQHRKASSVE